MRERIPGEKRIPRATAVLVLAFFSLTLFVFGPGTVFLTNPNEFVNTYQDLILWGILLAAGISLVLAALLLGLRTLGASVYEKGLSLVFAFGFLQWLQGNFLLWEYGPLDGRDIPWSKMARLGYVDGAIWLVVLAAAAVLSRFIVKTARKACLFLLIIQFGYGAVLFSRHPEAPNFKRFSLDAANEFLFSKHRNAIIIVLDTFQTDIFDEIIKESPELAGSFKGFTRFRNTLGGYPFTELSVILMLTGRYYDNSLSFEPWLKAAYEGNSLPRVLKANGWRVDLFPQISYSIYFSNEIASNCVRGVPFAERIRDTAYALDLGLFRSLPHFLKRPVYNDQDWFVARLTRRFIRTGPQKRDDAVRTVVPRGRITRGRNQHLFSRAASRNSQDVRFIEAMYAESTLGEDAGSFKFYHLSGPHLPLVLNENIRYVRMNVSRQNYLKAATASLKLTAVFLDRLRQMGIYDKSLILLVGDHGAGAQGQDFVLQPGMPVDEKGTVVTLPYRINALPLLLVKPLGASGDLETSDSPISVSDIPVTVFSELGLSVDAPGESMFSIEQSARRERRFLNYAGRDIYSYYGDMDEYIVDGPGWMDGAWRQSGRVFRKSRPHLRKRILQPPS